MNAGKRIDPNKVDDCFVDGHLMLTYDITLVTYVEIPGVRIDRPEYQAFYLGTERAIYTPVSKGTNILRELMRDAMRYRLAKVYEAMK